ncbi:hypothetical protein ELQ35_21480 [Peribacillus cavernae]|uniref:Tc1-like transposase DDE domain-containing protein n=1 Tax=Peribacillus cavernae TaxID=1674310 RepID=A0A433H887_9BACI|nr:transposase [Peribacillus cavernae]RUQ24551.1 hypothetical protein ELQ35_21480 [Peribacillus cavernae]
MEAELCNGQTFLAFPRYIVALHVGKHIVMILDNARIQHVKLLEPFLKEYEHRLTLLFLPPYYPNLYAVERIWSWLKGSVIVNRFHATRKKIRKW